MMKLTQPEIEQFYKLWYGLIWGINEKHEIVPRFKKPVYGQTVNDEPFVAVRKRLWEKPDLIDEFLRDNKYCDLTETERDILADWRKSHVKGSFVIWKHLSKYSIFITTENPVKLYGVCGISNSIKETARYEVPVMIETVLLPFNGKIIYDSFIGFYRISFGGGIKNSIKDSYNKAKKSIGIIENMSIPPVPEKPREKKADQKPAPPAVDTKGAKVPKELSARYMEIAEIIEAFCDEKLNDEFKEICLRTLAKLCRKRPSPVTSGRARTWACGVVYAIGSNNFIFDRSQEIYMPATEIAGWFGLSKSTAGSKSAEITKLLKISHFNSEFLIQDIIDNSPFVWYLEVNGLMMDVRYMPREVQEMAYRKGLIPYIPDDRKE